MPLLHAQAFIFTMCYCYIQANSTVTSLSNKQDVGKYRHLGLISLDLKAFSNLKNFNSMYKTHPDCETKFGGKRASYTQVYTVLLTTCVYLLEKHLSTSIISIVLLKFTKVTWL